MAIGMIAGLSSNDNDNLKLTLNKNFISLNRNQSTTITVNTPSDGKIYATSLNTNIVTVSINNNIITINAIKYGSANIYIGQDNGTGIYANTTPKIVQLFVIVPLADSILKNNSWPVISEVSQMGAGNLYWSIGDMKSITLNGKIGDGLTLSNFTTNVFILHFNYSMNGVADNNIIWGGFKDSNEVNIALIDSKYNNQNTDGIMYFTMNHWSDTSIGNNCGGWKGCDFRYDILGATSTPPSNYGTIHTTACVGYDATSATLTNPKTGTLLAALSGGFRSSLKLWSRWIDAKGNVSNVEANIKETIDAVTLLAEFEVLGFIRNANEYEQNHQSQMDYYRLGNSSSQVKYNYNYDDDYKTSTGWWLASPDRRDGYSFRLVNAGDVYSRFNYSFAIGPAFKT